MTQGSKCEIGYPDAACDGAEEVGLLVLDAATTSFDGAAGA